MTSIWGVPAAIIRRRRRDARYRKTASGGRWSGLATQSKRPLVPHSCADEINSRSTHGDDCRADNRAPRRRAGYDYKDEAGNRRKRRERIERNAKWSRKMGLADAENDHPHLLQHELQ